MTDNFKTKLTVLQKVKNRLIFGKMKLHASSVHPAYVNNTRVSALSISYCSTQGSLLKDVMTADNVP